MQYLKIKIYKIKKENEENGKKKKKKENSRKEGKTLQCSIKQAAKYRLNKQDRDVIQ